MGKKWTCTAAFALAMLVFAGVGMPRAKAQGKEPIAISMYLWDRTMMRQLTPYLEEKFPEIDFTFVPAYNTMVTIRIWYTAAMSCRISSPAADSR